MNYKKKKKYTIEKVYGFFPYAYNLFFILDIPPAYAFNAFAKVVRIEDKDQITEYLYDNAVKHEKKIRKMVRKSFVKYYTDVQEKFDYITLRMAELTLRKEHQ